ncbi:MAG: glycosyltransferase family protein [Syntrophorhabdaceae bacterium]
MVIDKEFQEKFLEEYINLIGSIGRDVNSKAWWATDMASKNRSTCRLPVLLYEFLSTVLSLARPENNSSSKETSWVLLDSLNLHMSGNKSGCHYVSKNQKWKEAIFMRVRTMARILRVLSVVFLKKFYFWIKLRNTISHIPPGRKYVIKTFLYNHSFDEKSHYKDTFFGSLPDFLKNTEKVLILADILGDVSHVVKKIRECRSHVIVPLEMFLSVRDVMHAVVEILLTKISLTQKYLFFGYDVTDIVKGELKRTCNGIPFYQYLHRAMIKGLVKKIKVETFLFTYENNPWEKMCMMAIRKYSQATKTIGYQHSVVPQASANAFISQYEADIIPTPDRILTVGEKPKKIMEKYGYFKNGKIEPACALRFEYLFRSKAYTRKKEGHILLALEGLDETHRLMNYAMTQLKGNSYFQVRYRTHPEMPINKFEKRLVFPLNEVPNFHLTGNVLLKDDLKWADVVLYWGSTVSLEALISGRPIIRYNMDTVLDNDPLFECNHLKWVVTDTMSLSETIEQIYRLDDESYFKAWTMAKQYLSDYFFPVTPERMKLFLPEKTR